MDWDAFEVFLSLLMVAGATWIGIILHVRYIMGDHGKIL